MSLNLIIYELKQWTGTTIKVSIEYKLNLRFQSLREQRIIINHISLPETSHKYCSGINLPKLYYQRHKIIFILCQIMLWVPFVVFGRNDLKMLRHECKANIDSTKRKRSLITRGSWRKTYPMIFFAYWVCGWENGEQKLKFEDFFVPIYHSKSFREERLSFDEYLYPLRRICVMTRNAVSSEKNYLALWMSQV